MEHNCVHCGQDLKFSYNAQANVMRCTCHCISAPANADPSCSLKYNNTLAFCAWSTAMENDGKTVIEQSNTGENSND